MSTFCTIDCELCEYCTLNAQGSNYRFTFCEVISSYFYCIVVNHTKIAMQCFPKEPLIRPNYIFSCYIHILFIHCILLSKDILLIIKVTPQNVKNVSQFAIFAKKIVCGRVKISLRSTYLLQSEFQMIIRMLMQ